MQELRLGKVHQRKARTDGLYKMIDCLTVFTIFSEY